MIPDEVAKHPIFKQYVEVRAVERGAFGHVFRAVDPATQTAVAIKVLLLGDNPEVLRRFSREAESQQRLSSPHLVKLLAMDFDSHPPAVVMEWIDGGSLDRWANKPRPPEPALVRQVARDLLAGAQVLQAADLVHRDIKPANVFLRSSGRALLGDLGMVGSDSASTISRTGIALGTPKYMPPEVLKGIRWTSAGDLFAIGLTLWEFATRVHPNVYFKHSLTMFLDPDLELPSLASAGAIENAPLQTLIDSLLQQDPDRRPPDAQTALEILGEEAAAAALDSQASAGWKPLTAELEADALATSNTLRPVAETAAQRGPERETAAQTQRQGPRRTTQPVAMSRELPRPPTQALPAPAKAALGPRIAAAAAAGGLLVLLAVLGGALRPEGGVILSDRSPTGEPAASRVFPPDFLPGPPSWRFASPRLIEFRWDSPTKAFAKGTSRSHEGIIEFSRGPSSAPVRLTLPAPAIGQPYTRMVFVLEDREGNQLPAEVPPEFAILSLAESASKFLEVTRRGASEQERRRLWEPLAELHGEGGIRDLDAAMHHQLDAASSDLSPQ